jgi:hypothetical protein
MGQGSEGSNHGRDDWLETAFVASPFRGTAKNVGTLSIEPVSNASSAADLQINCVT